MADIEAIRGNFRVARGKAQEEEWEQQRASLGPLSRSVANLVGGRRFDLGSIDFRRQARAYEWLAGNVLDGSVGTDFPLVGVSFITDKVSRKTEFSYRFTFDGSRIEEESAVDLVRNDRQVTLQRSETGQSLVGVERGQPVLRLPANSAIEIRAILMGEGGRAVDGGVGIWVPELSERPVPYSWPQNGRIRFG